MLRRRGHSLIELLVALGIFVFLSGALISFFNQSVTGWRIAEERGRIYERARALLDTISEDIRATATDVRAEGAGFWVRLLCDTDPKGRQRLRFVRALAGEIADPIARHGGEYLIRADSGHYDLHRDNADVENGRLLAPAGYQEVFYVLGPDAYADGHGDAAPRLALWRGIRSPVGGVGSLFINSNVEEPKTSKKKKSTGLRKAEIRPPLTQLDRVARPLAGRVLYCGFRFWTTTTTTWNPAYPALGSPGKSKPSGATSFWDSTRAVLHTTAKSGEFAWRPKKGSISDPYDDVFPERVEITLVLAGNAEVERISLRRAISVRQRNIPLSHTIGLPTDGPFRCVLIDDEWIRYEGIEGDELVLPAGGGRGARQTAAAKHAIGAPVLIGTSFRRIVEVPGFRAPVFREGKEAGTRERTLRRSR